MAVKYIDRVARKKERITIQKNAVIADKYRNRIPTWTDYFSCYAYAHASQYKVREGDAVVMAEERPVVFEVRWCPELDVLNSTEYRVVFRGENYNLSSVDHVDYARGIISLACTREARQEADHEQQSQN